MTFGLEQEVERKKEVISSFTTPLEPNAANNAGYMITLSNT